VGLLTHGRLLTHGLDLVHIVLGGYRAGAGAGYLLMAVAGPLYLIRVPLVGRRLLPLGVAPTAASG
jgi:hypothetical protein